MNLILNEVSQKKNCNKAGLGFSEASFVVRRDGICTFITLARIFRVTKSK